MVNDYVIDKYAYRMDSITPLPRICVSLERIKVGCYESAKVDLSEGFGRICDSFLLCCEGLGATFARKSFERFVY